MSAPTAANSAQGLITARVVLMVSVLVTAALYTLPFGRSIGYPLMLLSTLAHEMGHGLAALLSGGSFASFELYADGSGVAHTATSGRLQAAFVSAGGLVGPAVAAAVCFFMGRRPKRARVWLGIMSALLAAALLLVVRNVFGWVFIGGLAAFGLIVALRGGPRLAQGLLVFMGVQLGLSVYSRGDYLFTDVARTAAGNMPSDVAHMAEALLLPYWFWGALCGGFSIAVLIFGLWLFWRPEPAAAKPPPPAA